MIRSFSSLDSQQESKDCDIVGYLIQLPRDQLVACETAMATANGHPALPLSKRLKRASRETHNISNALVSARLVALFTDRSLYGKALGCFYHVHAELERCLDAAAAKDPSKCSGPWLLLQVAVAGVSP